MNIKKSCEPCGCWIWIQTFNGWLLLFKRIEWPTVISNSLFHFEIVRVNQDLIFLVCGQWILWVCSEFILKKIQIIFSASHSQKNDPNSKKLWKLSYFKNSQNSCKNHNQLYYLLYFFICILTVSQSGYFPNEILNNRSVLLILSH